MPAPQYCGNYKSISQCNTTLNLSVRCSQPARTVDKQLQQDELVLSDLLNLARKFAIGFRADDEKTAGSTLRELPDPGLPDLGGGAQDAMKVFKEQWQDFGGFAALIDDYAHLLYGWERADSITIDNHKWLNVVAFTLTDAAPNRVNALAQRLSDRGRYFLTPTTLFGRRGLGAAFVNWQCETSQVEEIMAELHLALEEIPLAPATAPP